jgi:hypothetical protein
MNERENLGAGIYAGLSAFLILISLIGAFVLPASITDSKWLGIPPLAAFLVGIPILLRMTHHSRIRDVVGKTGVVAGFGSAATLAGGLWVWHVTRPKNSAPSRRHPY